MPTATPFPVEIEVFRAGSRPALDGNTYTITPQDLATAAAAYDPALSEAPFVVGHPDTDKPAYGWAESFRVQDDVLLARHKQVDPAFAEMVSTGRFKQRSTAFYHPLDTDNPKPGIWYPKHVGWLGALAPAVKGLRPVFAGKSAGIAFSEPLTPNQEHTPMDEETKAKLDAAEAAAKKAEEQRDAAQAAQKAAESQLAEQAEQARQATHARNVAFAESQVKTGRLLPKEQASAVAVLDKLAAAGPVEFGEGDAKGQVAPVEFVKSLIEGTAPKVQFGEHAAARTSHQASNVVAGGAKGKSDAEIDSIAHAYAKQHNVAYAEALRAVTFTTDL